MRNRWDIGLLRALSPGIMMMMMTSTFLALLDNEAVERASLSNCYNRESNVVTGGFANSCIKFTLPAVTLLFYL